MREQYFPQPWRRKNRKPKPMKTTKAFRVMPDMKNHDERTTPCTNLIFSLSIALLLTARHASATVTVEKLPEPGLQPQTVTAPDGTVHLVYLAGDPKAADIQYRWRRANESQWSAPLRVNSLPGSAI